jgi:hypothetical protein
MKRAEAKIIATMITMEVKYEDNGFNDDDNGED